MFIINNWTLEKYATTAYYRGVKLVGVWGPHCELFQFHKGYKALKVWEPLMCAKINKSRENFVIKISFMWLKTKDTSIQNKQKKKNFIQDYRLIIHQCMGMIRTKSPKQEMESEYTHKCLYEAPKLHSTGNL